MMILFQILFSIITVIGVFGFAIILIVVSDLSISKITKNFNTLRYNLYLRLKKLYD